jgi:hypothetical protein
MFIEVNDFTGFEMQGDSISNCKWSKKESTLFTTTLNCDNEII